MRRSLPIALTLTALLACGKGEPPLPRLAPETLRFGLTPTRGEVPHDLRVTLDIPAEWARAGGGFKKTFSSGDADGVIFGNLSVELVHGQADDPAEVPKLLAERLEKARKDPASTAEMTLYEVERGALRQRGVARVVSPSHGFVLFCTVEASTGHSAALGDRLIEACKTAKLELAATTLPADITASERAKLTRCPPATNVVFTRSERALGPTAFGPVLAGRAFATSGDKIEIDLANYVHDDWKAEAKPSEGGQVRLAFEVFPSVDKHAISGRYPVRGRSFDASSQARLLSSLERSVIELAVEDNNGVDIVARTADKVCGSFVFSDGHHTTRGSFVLDLVVGRAR